MDAKQFLSEMGIRIAGRRKELGLTQEALAEQMNVSVQMISYMETGRKAIRPENLVKLCDALQVSADYVLTGRISQFDIAGVNQNWDALTPEQQRLIKQIIINCITLTEDNT